MKMPWFKMWAEFAFDPKIQSMDETLQRRYIMLLCLTCNDDLPKSTDEEVACALRLPPDETIRTREILTKKGLLEDGWTIHGWEKRQSQSGKSAERVRKFRERRKAEDVTKCNALRNVSVTPCNTIDIEVDLDKEKDKHIAPPQDAPKRSALSKDTIVSAYHEHCPDLPRVLAWNDKRDRALKSRIRENAARQELSWWVEFFKFVSRSRFLTGQAEPKDDRPPFKADLEWLLSPSNMTKVVEGKYHRDQEEPPHYEVGAFE